MTFNHDTMMEQCEDEVDLPTLSFNFVPISQLNDHAPNSMIGKPVNRLTLCCMWDRDKKWFCSILRCLHDIITISWFCLVGSLKFESCYFDSYYSNFIVDVIGVVKHAGDLGTVTGRQSQKEIKKRDLQMVDQSNTMVNLTLWGADVSLKWRNFCWY